MSEDLFRKGYDDGSSAARISPELESNVDYLEGYRAGMISAIDESKRKLRQFDVKYGELLLLPGW